MCGVVWCKSSKFQHFFTIFAASNKKNNHIDPKNLIFIIKTYELYSKIHRTGYRDR